MDHVLVVDDDDQMRRLMCVLLEEKGYDVAGASDGKRAMIHIQEAAVNLVISDVVMPNMDGLRLIREVKKVQPSAKILAVSGASWEIPDLYLNMAKHFGADAILMKPFKPDRFVDKVSALMGK